MTKLSEDTNFDTLEGKFPFLKNLPLKKFYGIFNSYRRFPPIGDFFCKKLKANDPHTCNLHSTCMNAREVFSTLYRMIQEKAIDSNINVCEHLNYWIYDNIKKISTCKEFEIFYEELNSLKSIYLENFHNCKNKNFKIIEGGFIKKKELFLLAEILHWIKVENQLINPSDSTSYNGYIDECVNFYKEYICTDIETIKRKYNNELTYFVGNFDDAVSILGENGVTIKQNKLECPHESQKQQTGERSAEDRKQESEGPVGPPGLSADGEQRVEELPGPQRSPRPEVPPPAGGHDLTGQDPLDTAVSGDPLEAVIPGKVGTVGATLAGSSLFLVMMYKYTPFGSWINTRVLKKDKLMENMNKNNYELLLNDVGNDKTSLNDPMYHIRYNSLTNQ
ncbi:PIR protein [Plasmodium vivax]|uniref:VIR protein n=1 Tax=Plasmodium vivax TaxID=5855 RepID=A0A564ZNF1_PLAVI|nr:PIR protein [Plasmodium vivax]